MVFVFRIRARSLATIAISMRWVQRAMRMACPNKVKVTEDGNISKTYIYTREKKKKENCVRVGKGNDAIMGGA